MGFLNEMATAWSLYLSFGVIFIFSECAFTEITSNDLAKKNYTNSNGMTDRNVSSTTPKLSKLSTAKMNTKTNLSAARSNGSEMLDSASFIGISNNATEKITHETYGSENTNERTSHKHPSSVSLQTIAYASTTPSILRFKKNETKANTDEDEKENLYIGFRNQDDAFKNVKKSTKKSIENQFSSGFVLPNIVASSAYDALKENISSQNTHKTLTHSTLPIKNDSSMRKWKLSTAKPANTPSSELFFSINQTFAPSVKTFPDTTFEKLPSSTLPNEILSEFTQETITNRDVLYNSSSTNQIQNSTFLFDLNPLRKNAHIGNLTSNNTADKNYPTSYDQSTIHTAEQTLHRQNKTANVAQTEILGITEVALDNGSVAVTEREWLATNTKNNFTSQFTPSKMQLININNSITNDNYVSTKLFVNHSISHVHPSHSSTLKNHTLNETKVNETRSINKEHLQFPGITLKVSHVLIPKQKRSRYNIRNMKIQLPKNELLNQPSAATPKNSNCTRFPIQVVTASDTETNEKVNLTEEHYDCEYSSELNNTQKEPAVSVHSYFSSYVFRYAVPNKVNLSISNQTANDTVRSTVPPYSDENDDYYSSYMEYSDPTNGSSNTDVEDGIIPDPDMNKVVTKTKPEALSVPIADTSITDNDLHDHDVIDSVMYIYFGGTAHGQHGAGRQIIIVGAVIALVAQFLTLASSIRRIKTHYGEEPSIVLLNIETALTLTNLTFILGVQSTSDHTLCKIIAVSLYYFHITALFWFLLSSVHSVQTVCHIEKPFKLYTFCIIGWILPFFITLTSYVVNERSFETNLYCWVSPLRGILISYIAPVILFCIICIILTVIGLKNITETTEDFDDTYSHKKLLRISAVALPLFSIIWFTGMVSLENSASLLFSLIFLMSNTVLNWLLFACWLPSEASQWKDMDEDYYDEEEDFDDEPVLVKRRFDDQPLLSELYEYGAQGQLYNLRVEPISIISTP